MSLTALANSSPTRAAVPAEASSCGVGAALASLAAAASDGVSATVSFSGEALHALAQAGESALGGTAGLAVGAWHAVQHAALEVEHLAESGWSELKHGLANAESAGAVVVEATTTAAKELGHYAGVALEATGDAVSEVASGTVFAAAAGGKSLLALL